MSRKIQYNKNNGRIWEYIVEDLRCICGCNVFHKEYNGTDVFGVCNGCRNDVYMIKPEFVNAELNKEGCEWK